MNSAPETYRFTHLNVHWTFTFALGKRPFVHPKPNVSISGYVVFGGNPIVNVDVLGDTIRNLDGTDATKSGPLNGMIKEIEKRKSDMETLKTKEQGKKKPNADKINEYDEVIAQMDASLQGINELKSSTQNFYIDPGHGGTTEGLVRWDASRQGVVISYNNKTALFVHETTHAQQFKNGQLSFGGDGYGGGLYDITDEVTAYKRQAAFAPETLRNVKVSEVNAAWVKKTFANYINLPSGSYNIHSGYEELQGHFYNDGLRSDNDDVCKLPFTSIGGFRDNVYMRDDSIFQVTKPVKIR